MVQNRIKEIMKQRKINQVELSEAIRVSPQSINRRCNNKYQPNLEFAYMICNFFEVPIQDMFYQPAMEKTHANV